MLQPIAVEAVEAVEAVTSEYVRTVMVDSTSPYTVPSEVYSLLVGAATLNTYGLISINGSVAVRHYEQTNGVINNIRCVSGDVVIVTAGTHAVLQEYTL